MSDYHLCCIYFNVTFKSGGWVWWSLSFFFLTICSLINKLKPGIIKRVNRLSTPIAGLVSTSLFLTPCATITITIKKNIDVSSDEFSEASGMCHNGCDTSANEGTCSPGSLEAPCGFLLKTKILLPQCKYWCAVSLSNCHACNVS